MSAIPSALISPLRAALQSAGFPADTITVGGELNPAGLLAGAYTRIEFRSSATPNVIIDTQELLKETSPNPFLAWARPTVILSGPYGDNVIAPYGMSNGGSILPGVAAVVLVGFLGFVVGRLSTK